MKIVDGAKLFNQVGTIGNMSQQTQLTPEQRIALVQKDRLRRYGQIAITFILIGFSLGFVAWYAFAKADDAFLSYMATGMLGVVFAGIGAAYAIMGLGRTVGSTNSSNQADVAIILAEIAKLQKPVKIPGGLPDIEDAFFEDNREDSLEEDRNDEVPIGRTDSDAVGAINADPSKLQYLADRKSWHSELKTIDGRPVVLIATQSSRRTKSKRTVYVYHIVGTNVIIYNRSRHGIFFMRIAFRPQNMSNYFDVFVNPPLTPDEQLWLERNDYVLV